MQVLRYIDSGKENDALGNEDFTLETVDLVTIFSIYSKRLRDSSFDTKNMFGNGSQTVFVKEERVKESCLGIKNPHV